MRLGNRWAVSRLNKGRKYSVIFVDEVESNITLRFKPIQLRSVIFFLEEIYIGLGVVSYAEFEVKLE